MSKEQSKDPEACQHEAGARCSRCPFPIGGFRPFPIALEAKEAGELTMTLRVSTITGEVEGQKLDYDLGMDGSIWVTIGKRTAVIPAGTIIEAVAREFGVVPTGEG